MTLASIVPIGSLVGVSPGVLESYGLKSAECATLLELQPASPFDYEVPEAFAIPAREDASFVEGDIDDTFDALTSGMDDRAVLMARSSSKIEAPGANPTYSVGFDPTDRSGSRKNFRDAVVRLLDHSPQMGVLAMPMVGTPRQVEGAGLTFGYDNVSFVADSHHPASPDEMHFALVHGLGTRAHSIRMQDISPWPQRAKTR